MKLYIYSDNDVIHAYDSSNPDYQIISGTLTMEYNRSGSLTFTVPPNNYAHKNGLIKDLLSVIKVVNTADNFYWYGRVLRRDVDFLGCCTYTCEGALSRLNDIVAYPIADEDFWAYKLDPHGDRYTKYSPCPEIKMGSGLLLKALVNQYNDRNTRFGLTRFDYSNPDSGIRLFDLSYDGTHDPAISEKDQNGVYTSDAIRSNVPYEKMLDYIQNNILNHGTYGYHIEMGRRHNQDLIIFISNDPNTPSTSHYTRTSSKALILGKNLLDFSYKTDYSNLYTAMHYKCTLSVEIDPQLLPGEIYDPSTFQSRTYTTTREYVLPLEATNGDFDPSSDPDHVISKYGLIMGQEDLGTFYGRSYLYDENINIEYRRLTENEFKIAAARHWKKVSSVPIETIEVQGLNVTDNDDTIPFRVNQYIPVISTYHNLFSKFLCTSATFDLCNISNYKITLGAKPDTATENWHKIYKLDIEDPFAYY